MGRPKSLRADLKPLSPDLLLFFLFFLWWQRKEKEKKKQKKEKKETRGGGVRAARGDVPERGGLRFPCAVWGGAFPANMVVDMFAGRRRGVLTEGGRQGFSGLSARKSP